MFVGWTRYYCRCIAMYFKFLAWMALHCTLWAKSAHGVWGLASSSESDSDGTGTSGSGSGLSSHASQTATDSDVSLLTSVVVVLKNTVTMRPTLRLCRQMVLMVYGVWQMFLPTEAWTLNPDDCMNEHPMRAVPAVLPRLQPNLQLESPFLWPLFSRSSR